MNLDERRIDVVHSTPCHCLTDGDALYVRLPCYVVGWHVTRRRIRQILYAFRARERSR